jgi:hypothetical protein
VKDFATMGEENTNEQICEDKAHCEICREIRDGCAADKHNPENCAMCNRKGYLHLGDGFALVCSACQRGFRLKLWLKHQELAGNHNSDFLFDMPVFVPTLSEEAPHGPDYART